MILQYVQKNPDLLARDEMTTIVPNLNCQECLTSLMTILKLMNQWNEAVHMPVIPDNISNIQFNKLLHMNDKYIKTNVESCFENVVRFGLIF